MNALRESVVATFTAFAACVLLGGQARAADASSWIDDASSSLRLIAGSHSEHSKSLLAGIEIKLKPGWHTYWRYPGDSGVPPRFRFPGSDNLAGVNVLYPAPQAFTDETGTTIGYIEHVIFPLLVTPRQDGKPVKLRLKADYAVCERLCVPVDTTAELMLPGGSAETDAALAAAQARVPKMESAAQAGLTARRITATLKPLVYVDLVAPTRELVQIFVEGPTPDWALPIPKPAQGAPAGHQHFSFQLDGLPPGIDPKGAFELTFTIVRAGKAPVEVKTHLD
jgi:DsbC/DsbD-like thiol-disulfide interchange protein